MNIVCGQAHPQKTLPKMIVNKIMKTINVIVANPKMKKSCGQKIMPKIINLRSRTFNMNNGSPETLIKGNEKKITK